ncbi:MAG: DUF2334 domain-containing protein [bacterium]|nr:DUF2334 domain-containing protein [bacterium]
MEKHNQEGGMQQLLIRLDDITPDMDWEKFERLEALFEQYGIHPIIGVVPDNRDETLHKQEPAEDFWERIRALADAGWVVAQHGFTHVYVNRNTGLLGINPFSEFAGLPYQEQYEKLKAGQEILRKNGISASMFMAPGHTFDKRTLKALRALGFVSVTDGYDDRPYRRGGLLFFPCTLSEPRLPKRFDTLCLHSNEMGQAQFDALAEFIGRNRKVIGNADEICACAACGARFYVPMGWLWEHKNLFLRRVKRFTAENGTVQAYFQRTDADDPAEKRKKRLRGLPGLLFRLLSGKSY